MLDNRLGSQLPGSPDRGPMGSEGSPDAYQLVGAEGSLWEWCLAKGITVRTKHIPRVENVRADRESRCRPDPSDWKMDSKVFLQIFNRLVPLLFAVRHNAQLLQYFSFKPDPGAAAVDAFAQDWSNLTPVARRI